MLGRKGGMIKSLEFPFWLGLGGNIGDGKQPLPWIYITDMCKLIGFCMENNNMEKDVIINGVTPNIITNAEFTKVFITFFKTIYVYLFLFIYFVPPIIF